jgi:predicted AAA+ superfamily ATPase
MIPREAEPALHRLAGYYPVVAVTGPRQSGKTTLARAAFPHKPYASLEELDVRDFALADPRGFLAQYPEGAVLDEVQRAPDLFSYLQTRVDAEPRPGQFVLTGSQQFGLLGSISQSLAGRVGLVHLLPFSLREVSAIAPPADLETLLWQGCYPPLHDRGIPPGVWYRDYVATYVERDVRQLVNVRDLSVFRRFVRMCAARSAQLLNLSALAADCGVTHNTARSWISVLEASYIVFLLPAYHSNFGKRLVKAPKLYFYDSGLAAWLAGIRSARELGLGSLRGQLFETWGAAEFVKYRSNLVLAPELYHWRDASGNEIDLLVERDGAAYPVEFKAGQTMAGDWLAPLEKFLALTRGKEGALVFGGAQAQARAGIAATPWREIGRCAAAAFGAGRGA